MTNHTYLIGTNKAIFLKIKLYVNKMYNILKINTIKYDENHVYLCKNT